MSYAHSIYTLSMPSNIPWHTPLLPSIGEQESRGDEAKLQVSLRDEQGGFAASRDFPPYDENAGGTRRYVRVCLYVYVYVYTVVCVYVCMYVCMYGCVWRKITTRPLPEFSIYHAILYLFPNSTYYETTSSSSFGSFICSLRENSFISWKIVHHCTEEHDQLTFKPEISEIGKRMQSSLKLREDPAFFLQVIYTLRYPTLLYLRSKSL